MKPSILFQLRGLGMGLAIATLTLVMPGGSDAWAKNNGWQIDQAHSRIGFVVRHLGISRVRGVFNDYDGTFEVDGDGRLTSVSATAQAKSIDTGIQKRDNHLRSDDFFNAEKHPELKVQIKKFRWNGERFEADADLTIRGNTKKVTFKGEHLGTRKVNFGALQMRTGFTASTTINRQDFGLKFNALAEGVSVVADDVTIEIELELFRPI